MAKEYVYFQGKCSWAKLAIPDPEYKKWQLILYFTPKSLEDFRALKLRTHLKKDDDGYFARLSRPVSKRMGADEVAFLPPKVFLSQGEGKDPIPFEGLLGNGSDVTVKCEVYKFTPPGGGGKQNAIRMESVRIDNLIPYEPRRDFTDDEAKAAEGLKEQPEQLF